MNKQNNQRSPCGPRCMTNRGGLWVAVAATAWLVGACASTPPPTEQMAVAAAAVTHAMNAGAQEAAPGDMRTARDKLERAKQAVANKENALALNLAQQAQLDAQLAEAKAHADKARKAAEAVQDGNSALREEMNRKAKN
jgi:septal ring factor EnvC (AmiA/AmiB activator)